MKTSKKESVKLKVVIYFLIGFIANWLGLIIGLFWLKFKAKTYRKQKLVSLLIGFVIYFVYSFIISPLVLQPILQPQIDQAFFKEHPDAGEVTRTIQQRYPDAKIFVRIDENTFSVNGAAPVTTRIFSVQYRSSKQFLTSKQMQDIAKQTCSILKNAGKTYDKVLVLSLKYTLPLKLAELHKGIQKSCTDWETKDFSNTKFPF